MIKRLFDAVFSLAGLIVLLPLFGVIALVIKLDSPGPVFYRGGRVGRIGRPFRMYKFRTMVVNAEKLGGWSTPDDDPRITRAGKVLRKYKLDELPQLINVLRGEMSLVGPRPQVSWAAELYSKEEIAILQVLPGITDYASLRFWNEGEILHGSSNPDKDYLENIHPEKMHLSLEYVHNQSFWLDCKLLIQTATTLLFGIRWSQSASRAEGGRGRR